MGLKIYFLRHGETPSSQIGNYCGRLDADLTPEGYQMAEDFAKAYENLLWTAIYVSPLKRTLETAKILSRHWGIEPQIKEGLTEIAYGKWEGKSPADVNQQFRHEYARWLADPGWNAPTGGEKGIDVARRSAKVLEEIEQTHPEGDVLVISHKSTIRIMLCSLLGVDIGRFRDRIAMPVASLTIVEMAEHGPLVHLMGDRSHLRQELQQRKGT